MSFGVFSYTTTNLGDNIQSLAALQLLEPIQPSVLIDRDRPTASEETRLIYSGWFDGRYSSFPPPSVVNPLFVSFHLNEADLPDYYDAMMPRTNQSSLLIPENVKYLKKHEPIGCRDLHTVDLLLKHHIEAYFSGCLTLTLKVGEEAESKTHEILLVDIEDDSFLPEDFKKTCTKMSHKLPPGMSHKDKMSRAKQYIRRYSQAELVISTRLHVVLPCLGMKQRAVFVVLDPEDVRYKPYLKYLKVFRPGIDTWSSFLLQEEPFYPFYDEVEQLKDTLKQTVWTWIHQPYQQQKISRGLSIFTACMGREEHLSKTLPTWLRLKPDEIVIVMWGQNNKKNVELQKMLASGSIIRVVEVPHVKRWVLSWAFNLAAKHTRFKHLLKLDCDSLVQPNFRAYHNLHDHIFFTGNWRIAQDENARHLNGLLYVKRKHFFKAGMYMESFTDYGWEDTELTLRLSGFLTRYDIHPFTVEHVKHDNGRIQFQPGALDPKESIQRNRLCPMQQFARNYLPQCLFRFISVSSQRSVAELLWSPVDPNHHEFGFLTRSPSALSVVPHEITTSATTSVISSTSSSPLFQKKYLHLRPLNGLGNRLRALASAYVISEAQNRRLKVHWIADIHCNALFEDLFQAPQRFEVVNESFPQGVLNDTQPFDEGKLHLYIASAKVLLGASWDLQCEFLQTVLKPTSAILKHVSETKEDVSNRIGVHIRMGQDPKCFAFEDTSYYDEKSQASVTRWRQEAHWTAFEKEIKRILSIDSAATFFVCADNTEAPLMLMKEFGPDKIWTLERTEFDRSTTQIQGALVEMLLLATTKKGLLISNWSSFSEGAMRFLHKANKNLPGFFIRCAGKDF
jgi:Polysaccharide pyruvyl transferase